MKMHKTFQYLLNPTHKVTIDLVGVGGTGSQVLSSLARIHTGLIALGHPGIHVRAFDHDTVSIANVGRQLFSPGDIGLNKAIISITRINRFFGLEWEARNSEFDPLFHSNILITCVDTAKTRIEIGKGIIGKPSGNDHGKRLYWLDFGNSQKSGQVVLGTIASNELKTVTQMFDLSAIKEKDQGPSCSLAEALGKQDLFINSTLANLGCNLLWKLITEGQIDYQGLYLNLKNMQVRPIRIEDKEIA